jgi:hypothetical protein
MSEYKIEYETETLRDKFAMFYLNITVVGDLLYKIHIIKAYEFADEMLEVRKEKREEAE